MKHLTVVDPELAEAIQKERIRQETTIELIASENLAPLAVLEAESSVLMNKSAEGYPGRRYFGGCQWVDVVESLAIERAKKLFGAEHANVQPHSGVNANLAVYLAALKPGDRVLAMDLSHGGHLSHGYPLSLPGQIYRFQHYGVDRETERLDYDRIRDLAREMRPRMIVAGASAYPRTIDFAAFGEIADEVGAYLMVDMAHIAGLVAAGLHPSPIPYADFVTHTTYKTMAGGRGGVIYCRAQHAAQVDRAVFPGIQGTPALQAIAAKAVTFKIAMSEEFRAYQAQILRNARALAAGLAEHGFRLVAGGTDNHLMLVDLRSKGISGKEAQEVLENVGIATNKNVIPFDPAKPAVGSGIRLGTPAVTRRGFTEEDMVIVADLIGDVLETSEDEQVLARGRKQVQALTTAHPLFYE
ncbi:MAG: serine hydroxymethyltransferase [Anaerolineales bacterium]|nr:MAG: serine hydroxymethyltransferase [Anaerolineales bacterium]